MELLKYCMIFAPIKLCFHNITSHSLHNQIMPIISHYNFIFLIVLSKVSIFLTQLRQNYNPFFVAKVVRYSVSNNTYPSCDGMSTKFCDRVLVRLYLNHERVLLNICHVDFGHSMIRFGCMH